MDQHLPGDVMNNHHLHHMIEGSSANEHNPHLPPEEEILLRQHSQGQVTEWSEIDQNEAMKRVVLELQRHWISESTRHREKLLIEVTEKLHEEFLADEEKTRSELCQQFKEELENTKEELVRKYAEELKTELELLDNENKKELAAAKQSQWCWQCEKEAIYPCCWNTSYCGLECQQAHWPNHKKFCRRKKSGK